VPRDAAVEDRRASPQRPANDGVECPTDIWARLVPLPQIVLLQREAAPGIDEDEISVVADGQRPLVRDAEAARRHRRGEGRDPLEGNAAIVPRAIEEYRQRRLRARDASPRP